MKGFIVLAIFGCLAAAHAYSTELEATPERTRQPAKLGDNPYFVHLRLAVANSGFLETCAGSIIDNRWVLTTASCLVNSRYIWIRYGWVNVINPELVTEATAFEIHPSYEANTGQHNLGLVSIGRYVHYTPNVKPLPLDDIQPLPTVGKYCSFGSANTTVVPGESLSCFNIRVERQGFHLDVVDDVFNSWFDFGGALVDDNDVLVGILTQFNQFTILRFYRIWLEFVTGSELNLHY